MEKFYEVINTKFYKNIENQKGKIYFVGGMVRDHYLGIENNDIDIVICNLVLDDLINILKNYGKTDEVGKSFGVIKFYSDELQTTIDVALPRKDKKGIDFKHRSIEVEFNHLFDITIDLGRRDFRVNSMALTFNSVSHTLELIDPFGGEDDIHHSIIAATNPSAFEEDPLRLIRAVQFSSRFQFEIEPETLELIKTNAFRIKEITPERILMEFQKVIDKSGDPFIFMDRMHDTGLWNRIFNFSMKKMIGINPKTISELLFFTVRGENPSISNWGDFFEEKLKIDTKTKKELRAFEIINDAWNNNNTVFENRMSFFKALQICPWIINSNHFELNGVDKNDFHIGRFPKSFKDLDISGEEFIALGLEGKAIGDMQRELVDLILHDKLENGNGKIKKHINAFHRAGK